MKSEILYADGLLRGCIITMKSTFSQSGLSLKPDVQSICQTIREQKSKLVHKISLMILAALIACRRKTNFSLSFECHHKNATKRINVFPVIGIEIVCTLKAVNVITG